MITLKIFNPDGSVYWQEYFDTIQDQEVWLNEEQTRPYWDPNFTTQVIDDHEPMTPVPPTADELAVLAGLQAQAKGAEIIAAIYALNDSKNVTSAEIQTLMADATWHMIERLLWAGAIETAKGIIQGYTNAFYTDADKVKILALFP
jgi:hypothetical protein